MNLNQDLASLSLHIGSPEQTDMNIGQTGFQPFNGLSMQVPVNEIDFFEKNPRHSHDPEMYARIKESIRASGIQQPVHITKRPNMERYVLARGGNTRLKIVKELFSETGDSRYSQIPCIYVEYVNDHEILAAHARENEMRSDMSFWDKASMYAELREDYEEATGKKLSLRSLESFYSQDGIELNFSNLAVYLFASTSLFGLGNFCNALSLPKSKDLRQQFNDLKQKAKTADPENETLFDMFWEESMFAWAAEQAEDAELDIASIQDFVAKRFASTFKVELPQHDDDTDGTTALPLPQPPSKHEAAGVVSAPQSEDAATSDGLSPSTPSESIHPTLAHQSDSANRQAVTPAADSIIPEETSDNSNDSTTATVARSRTRSEIQQDLLEAVKRLLKTVNLEKYMLIDLHMPYGFLLEFPSLSREPLKSRYHDHSDEVERHGAIYLLHPFAGYVFHKLWEVSWEKDLFYGIGGMELPNGHNPFPAGSQVAASHETKHSSDQVMLDILKMDLYEQKSHREFFDFLTKNAEARSAFTDFLRYCAELEENGGDNIEYALDNPEAVL